MKRNLEKDLEAFDRDGFRIFENVIDPDLIEEIRNALIKTENDNDIDIDIGYRDTKFEGNRTIRIYNLLAHGETFWKIPIHRAIPPFAEAVSDEELQLSSLSSITLCPGQEAQSLHADDQLLPVPKPQQPFNLNCVWAISDFTEENGATRIVPGSHKADGSPGYDLESDTIAAEMPSGSVVISHGSLWHAVGANTTDERRYTIANYYCSGFFRPQETSNWAFRSTPPSGFRGAFKNCVATRSTRGSTDTWTTKIRSSNSTGKAIGR